MACTLLTSNANALVRGDSTLQSYNTTASTPRTAAPFQSSPGGNTLEILYFMLMEGFAQTEWELRTSGPNPAWLKQALNSSYALKRDITSIEATLAEIASLSYAVIIEQYRQRYAQGDATVAKYWQPETTTLQGTHPILLAKLAVNWTPLSVGLSSTIILALITLTVIWGHSIVDPIIRDGQIVDLISLLHESALPKIMGADDDGVALTEKESRRRAEKTRVE